MCQENKSERELDLERLRARIPEDLLAKVTISDQEKERYTLVAPFVGYKTGFKAWAATLQEALQKAKRLDQEILICYYSGIHARFILYCRKHDKYFVSSWHNFKRTIHGPLCCGAASNVPIKVEGEPVRSRRRNRSGTRGVTSQAMRRGVTKVSGDTCVLTGVSISEKFNNQPVVVVHHLFSVREHPGLKDNPLNGLWVHVKYHQLFHNTFPGPTKPLFFLRFVEFLQLGKELQSSLPVQERNFAPEVSIELLSSLKDLLTRNLPLYKEMEESEQVAE